MFHRHHVVIVEDHDDIREVLETALDLFGARVTAFDNARDALTALRDGLDPCVVLLDWRMPDMDGEGFLRARMDHVPLVRTPVVAVTGDGLQRERAMTHGIREVIQKPMDPWAVFAAVARHCERRESD